MSYASWSVVFGEQPSAAKWNILGTNDASFNDGTGIGTNAVAAASLATNAIRLGSATITSSQNISSATPTQVPGLTSTVTIPSGSRYTLILVKGYGANTNANRTSNVQLWDGVVNSGTRLDYTEISTTNAAANQPFSLIYIAQIAAGSKTFNVGFATDGAGTFVYNASATGPGNLVILQI